MYTWPYVFITSKNPVYISEAGIIKIVYVHKYKISLYLQSMNKKPNVLQQWSSSVVIRYTTQRDKISQKCNCGYCWVMSCLYSCFVNKMRFCIYLYMYTVIIPAFEMYTGLGGWWIHMVRNKFQSILMTLLQNFCLWVVHQWSLRQLTKAICWACHLGFRLCALWDACLSRWWGFFFYSL